jgi:rod shape-determining protein MreC
MRLPQPEKSRFQPGLLIVLIMVALVLTTVWYREGTRGPVHRLRGGVQAAAAPVSAVGEFITRPVRGALKWVADLGVSRSQFQQLQQQNERLRNTVAALEEQRLENSRLQSLVNFAQTTKLKALGAHVIGRPTQWDRVITLDRGTADGVHEGMPVVGSLGNVPKKATEASAAGGLIGQTVQVTAHSAKVRMITDQGSGVASMIQANRAEGIVRGAIDGSLKLDFISHETTVKAGDVIITSGMGGVYPKGLLVGEVTKVTNQPSSLYQDVTLSPSANLNGLEEVLILVGPTSQVPPTGSGE